MNLRLAGSPQVVVGAPRQGVAVGLARAAASEAGVTAEQTSPGALAWLERYQIGLYLLVMGLPGLGASTASIRLVVLARNRRPTS